MQKMLPRSLFSRIWGWVGIVLAILISLATVYFVRYGFELDLEMQELFLKVLLIVGLIFFLIFRMIRFERPTHHDYWSHHYGNTKVEDINFGEQKSLQFAIIIIITYCLILLDMLWPTKPWVEMVINKTIRLWQLFINI